MQRRAQDSWEEEGQALVCHDTSLDIYEDVTVTRKTLLGGEYVSLVRVDGTKRSQLDGRIDARRERKARGRPRKCKQEHQREEQPIGVAFTDDKFTQYTKWTMADGKVERWTTGGVTMDELVFDADIFWGTLKVDPDSVITRRNNARVEALLQQCLPRITPALRLCVASFLHYHY
jgi:hypothetical protein